MRFAVLCSCLFAAVGGVAWLAGCGAIEQVARMPTLRERRAEQREREDSMRKRFLVEGDSKAIRWLLANSIEEGMDIEEVNKALGQDGEYVEADNFVKTKTKGFHLDDTTYRWGPDDRGKVYFLVFRERKLVNFDPSQYGRGAE